MKDFGLRPAKERAEIIEQTSATLKIGRPSIVEKDFWVCWVLLQLYGSSNPFLNESGTHPILFKGGTSLSKVYNLIDRFSEDVDLTIDRTVLVDSAKHPDEERISTNERLRRIDTVSSECEKYLKEKVLPYLNAKIEELGAGMAEVDETDRQLIRFTYPQSLKSDSYGGGAYVNTEIRLEFGARGEIWPAKQGKVSPYIALAFPNLFPQPSVDVMALSAERTFWEKATILHAIAQSGNVGNGERQSRHYADLATIWRSKIGASAAKDVSLLESVARHKTRYFPKASARYDLARPGTLRLVPSVGIIKQLEGDYARMREMYINDPPSFKEIIDTLATLEAEINKASPS